MSSSLSFLLRAFLCGVALVLFGIQSLSFFGPPPFATGIVFDVLTVLFIVAALGYIWYDRKQFGGVLSKNATIPLPRLKKKGRGDEQYQIYRDTYYHKDTPETLVHVLDAIREYYTHVRIHYGDLETGEEDTQAEGYVSRTIGSIQIPLLVQLGGDDGVILLDHRILHIVDLTTDQMLYQHPSSDATTDPPTEAHSPLAEADPAAFISGHAKS